MRAEVQPADRLGPLREASREREDSLLRSLGELQAEDEELTLAESALVSGYSKRRLSELIKDGTLENVGRRGAPRLRRGDLPVRGKSKKNANGFDAVAEARSVMGAS